MADLTKTRAELVNRALDKLGVVGSGQSPEDEDAAKVDAVVDALIADLAVRTVYYVGNVEEIDVAAFEWLAMCLANLCAEDFGKPMDANKQAFAERMLRALVATHPTYEPQTATYY